MLAAPLVVLAGCNGDPSGEPSVPSSPASFPSPKRTMKPQRPHTVALLKVQGDEMTLDEMRYVLEERRWRLAQTSMQIVATGPREFELTFPQVVEEGIVKALAGPLAATFHPVESSTEDPGCAKPSASGLPSNTRTEACDPSMGVRYQLAAQVLDGSDLAEVSLTDAPGTPDKVVTITMKADGAKTLEKVTGELAGKPAPQNQFAIVVDGEVLTAPMVQGPIAGGVLQLSGAKSEVMHAFLKAAQTRSSLKVAQVKTVG